MSAAEIKGVDGVPLLGSELLNRQGRVVDLSGDIYTGMPTFALHQQPFIFVNHTHAESVERFGVKMPFEAHNLLISEHTGTHTDAIFEYDPKGPALDATPLAYYYGDAVCLDLAHVRHPAWIGPDELGRALAQSGEEIRPGDIVLLHTGHRERTWPSQSYLVDQAGLSDAGARWLAERGVVNIGIDAVSIDHSDDPEMSAHVVCREYHIVNTESLANLHEVMNQRFKYYGLPLNIRAGTGSPIRAIAVLPD